MRVLHVDTGREWRGGQTQLLHLVRASDGDQVVLPPDAPLRPALEALGIPVHPVAFRGAWWGWRALAQVIATVAPDLVAAHTSHAHGHAVLAGGSPLVVHRRLDFRPGSSPLHRAKYRAATGYVAVSTAVRRVLVGAGVPSDLVQVVHDGVDPRPFTAPVDRVATRRALGVAERAVLIGAVGALVDHKGHRHLIDAMAELVTEVPRVVCAIAGEGSRRRDLVARLVHHGLVDRVLLPGHLDDIPAFLGALDVYCHPSVDEGMGQSVVEAMLAGVPVVSTSAGGLVDVIEDGVTGLVVPPRSGRALARGIHATLRAPDRAALRSTRARQVAGERFHPEQMVAGTRAAYARFAAHARSRSS